MDQENLNRNQSGQSIFEYILLVVIVIVSALISGAFFKSCVPKKRKGLIAEKIQFDKKVQERTKSDKRLISHRAYRNTQSEIEIVMNRPLGVSK